MTFPAHLEVALRDAELTLIGGAPRSGTTMMCNLFDGHPGVLMFHPEIHFLLGWLRAGGSNRDGVLAEEEIFHFPQFPPLVDLAAREAKRRQLRKSMGQELMIDTDPDRFRRAYVKLRRRLGEGLDGSLRSLAGAYWVASPGAAQTCDRLRRLVFKCPYYVDLLGIQAPEAVPGAHWIHMLREPLARYRSAKTRRLKRGRVPWLNRHRFVVGHQQVTFSAHHLANGQRSRPRHHVVYFEEVAENAARTMQSLAGDLQLDWHDLLRTPTRFAVPVRKNTSYWRTARSQEPSAEPAGAKAGMPIIMNRAESIVFEHLWRTANVFERYGPPAPRPGRLLPRAWFGLHHRERLRDWARGVWQLRWLSNGAETQRRLREELPSRVFRGKAGVGGAT